MNTNPTEIVSESVPLESSQKRAKRIKRGLDVHGAHHVVVRQMDEAAAQPAQRFTPAQFLVFARKQRGLIAGICFFGVAGVRGWGFISAAYYVGVLAVQKTQIKSYWLVNLVG